MGEAVVEDSSTAGARAASAHTGEVEDRVSTEEEPRRGSNEHSEHGSEAGLVKDDKAQGGCLTAL